MSPWHTASQALVVFAALPVAAAAQPSVRQTDCIGVSVAEDASCDPHWALVHAGIDRAHRMIRARAGETPGHGVTIAHVDTGYTEHPELPHGNMRSELGYRFECDADYDRREPSDSYDCDERRAIDPLKPAVLGLDRQPGHGTGTLSILASPHGKTSSPVDVQGAAPGSTIIPFRVTGGAILAEARAWHLARGITRATQVRDPPVEVMSISLGRRSPFPDIEKAVRLAERRGIIVVAAAGQGSISPHGGHVRFPAAYPGVVAAAGSEVDASPWDSWFYSSGKGREVDISAPAVGVWRAATERKPDQSQRFLVGRGVGTSNATALVAGTAAIWIHWWGSDQLEKTYGRAAVPAAFKMLLETKGYRTPAQMCDLAKAEKLANADEICSRATRQWPSDMGPGILAADKLLQAELPDPRRVCRRIWQDRGAESWATLCPRDTPGHDAALLAQPMPRPGYRFDPRLSLVAAVTVGAPFGGDAGWRTPVLSFGAIIAHHQFDNPEGLWLQGKIGEHGFSAGLGYAQLFEYGPLRNAEGKYAAIPGFGAVVGWGVKASYMRTTRRDYLGTELTITLWRAKAAAGLFRSVRGDNWRVTWETGVGF